MPNLTLRDGTTLSVKDWGEGPAVVFCHGWPLNADMWEGQMLALARAGFRCVAHDRRGFGRSSQPWNGYDYDTFADDLDEVIEAMELTEVTLVGFSMGGGEVARYLSRHGAERVSRAVLIGAVTPYLLQGTDNPDGVDRSVFDGMRAGIEADRAEFFRGFGRAFLGADRPGSSVSEGALDWHQGMVLMAGLKGTLDCVTAFSETDFRPDLRSFDLPTLLIHGDDDAIVPIGLTARKAVDAIRGARLEVIAGGPHGICHTHREVVNGMLLGFLRG